MKYILKNYKKYTLNIFKINKSKVLQFSVKTIIKVKKIILKKNEYRNQKR